MGTRFLTVIKKNEEIKLAQYGQWDGVPEVQGIRLLSILRKIDLHKLSEKVDKIVQISEQEIKELDGKEDWEITHPELSRDTGVKIIELIMEKDILKVNIVREFLDESVDIRFTYLIDFDENELKVYSLHMNGNKPMAKFKLDKLPTDELFIKKCKSRD